MADFFRFPELAAYRLINARLPTGETGAGALSKLHVRGGRISQPHDGPVIDLDGAMVLPAFTDMHTHLDKGHIWPRSPNLDGSFESALEAVMNDRTGKWCGDDVSRRMDFAIRCAFAHGSRALRTHLDSKPPQYRITWPVFAEARENWRGRIELQGVSLLGIDLFDEDGGYLDVAETVAAHGGVLGCFTFPIPDLDSRLDSLFAAASRLGLDVDFHADESSDAGVATLRSIARAVKRNRFEGKVVAGHCCSLALQQPEEADRTLDLVAEAGIAVVSLPMCNMYLQDRIGGRTPRWRGVTLVHEMRSRGIEVAFASDNTRDPFYAYGDLDMVEVLREATRICHLDHSDPPWVEAVSAVPNRMCGFSECRLKPGDPADFVIFNARNMSELLPRPQSDRIVIRNGTAIDRTLPSYRELDDLMED